MQWMAVVLPAPFGPRRPRMSPLQTLKLNESRAVKLLNRFVSWLTSVMAFVVLLFVESCCIYFAYTIYNRRKYTLSRGISSTFQFIPAWKDCRRASVEGES